MWAIVVGFNILVMLGVSASATWFILNYGRRS